MSSLLVVVKSHLFPALYNDSQFVDLNWEKGEEAAVTSNGHSGERRRERDEAVAVICSGRAREREVRWRQSFAVGGHRERWGRERSEAWLLMGQRRGTHETK